MKTCTKCQLTKALVEFARKRNSADGAAKNPVRRKSISLAYAHRNLGKIKAYTRENPERFREGRRRRQAQRKARIAGNGGTVSRHEWLAIAAITNGVCPYCNCATKLTVDHWVPIAKGGGTVRGNLLPCCQHCNSQKGDNEPHAWVLANRGPEAVARALVILAA